MIYKNRDIETNINERNIDLGNIDVTIYANDRQTASLRLVLRKEIRYGTDVELEPIDLTKTTLVPKIDLIMGDDSIFGNEPLEEIDPKNGVVQYNIPPNVVKHIGRAEASVKLIDANDVNTSVQVAMFYFEIADNGLTERIGKEINSDILEDKVRVLIASDYEKYKNLVDEIKNYEGVINKAKSMNLFSGYTERTTISSKSGKEFPDDRNVTSNFIEVEEEEQYTVGVKNILNPKRAMMKVAFYNKKEDFIMMTDWYNLAESNNRIIDTPLNTRYVKIVVNIEEKDEVYINYGTKPFFMDEDFQNDINENKIENLFTSFIEATTLSKTTGSQNPDSKNVTSDFMHINSKRNYTVGVKNILDPQRALYKIAYYDEGKNFITITDWNNLAISNNQVITPADGAKYARLVVSTEHKDEAFFNLGNIPYFETNSTANNIETEDNIVNLFGSYKDNVTLSKTTGSENPDDKNITSDFIRVNDKNKYIIGVQKIVDEQRTAYKIAFYDDNRNFITLQDWKTFDRNNLSEVITLPVKTKYVRVVINKENKGVVYFNVGDKPYYVLINNNTSTNVPTTTTTNTQVRNIYKTYRPYPQKLKWKLIDGNTSIKPLDLSRDGKLILASNGASVAQSIDEGDTWNDVGGIINGTLIQSVRILDDGELLVGTSKDVDNGVKSSLYKSKGYNVSDPSKTTFYEVLEMNSGDANFNNPWCLDKYYNIILASEYGGHYLTGARYVYLSTDYGETWKTIFDQSQMALTVDGAPSYTTDAHVHTCHYDRYRDRIWVCVGDQDNTATYYSDDMGKTWKIIKGYTGKETMQYTGITSYPEGVFFGSDRSPDGVYFWNETKPDAIEPFFLTEREKFRTLVYALPFRRFAEKDEICYFTANRDGIVDGKMGPIIVGLKGVLGAQLLYDFTDDFNQFTYTDISGCLGNTAQGNVIVSVKDNNTNRYRLLRAKAPVWE